MTLTKMADRRARALEITNLSSDAVTAAMIDAGIAALDAYGSFFPEQVLVTEIYRAMRKLDTSESRQHDLG